jgi:hypothetical protein
LLERLPLVWVAVLCLLLLGSAHSTATPRPNIGLISIDTFRAEEYQRRFRAVRFFEIKDIQLNALSTALGLVVVRLLRGGDGARGGHGA